MPHARFGPFGAVRLPDGRSISFISAGPADGVPVVSLHGAIGSPRWRTPGLDELIDRLSIRYLVINRPGFGGSDPSPGRSVVDFASDLGQEPHRVPILADRLLGFYENRKSLINDDGAAAG